MLSEYIRRCKKVQGKEFIQIFESHKNILFVKEQSPSKGKKEKKKEEALLCYYKLFFAKHVTVQDQDQLSWVIYSYTFSNIVLFFPRRMRLRKLYETGGA